LAFDDSVGMHPNGCVLIKKKEIVILARYIVWTLMVGHQFNNISLWLL